MSNSISIRDRRGLRHYWAEYVVMAHYRPLIGKTGLDLYHFYASCVNQKSQTFVGMKTIQEFLGYTRATVIRYNHSLQWCGLIRVVSPKETERASNEYQLLGQIPCIDVGVREMIRANALATALPNSNKKHRTHFLDALDNWKPLFNQYDIPAINIYRDLHPIIESVYRTLNVDYKWIKEHGKQQAPERVLAHAWYAKSQEGINHPAAFLQAQLQRHSSPPADELALARHLLDSIDTYDQDELARFLTTQVYVYTRDRTAAQRAAKTLFDQDAFLLLPASQIQPQGVIQS